MQFLENCNVKHFRYLGTGLIVSFLFGDLILLIDVFKGPCI